MKRFLIALDAVLFFLAGLIQSGHWPEAKLANDHVQRAYSRGRKFGQLLLLKRRHA